MSQPELPNYPTSVSVPAFGEGSHNPPEVELLGKVGDIARGTMGVEAIAAEAETVLQETVPYLVRVAPRGPKTCMDDGEASGSLSGIRTEPRAKMGGGSAMADWLGDELTLSARIVGGQVRPGEMQFANPLDRFRATRRERVMDGTVEHAGAHVRLGGAEDASGCGMADKLPKALGAIIDEAGRSEGDRLAPLVANFMRVAFNEKTHRSVVADARRLLVDLEVHGYTGHDFIESIRKPEPEAPFLDGPSEFDDDIEVTTGGHAPILFVVNNCENTTIDRDAYVAETGHKVLWIDESAIWEEAQLEAVDSTDMQEVAERYQSIMTANIAAAVTLGGPQLHVGVVGRLQPQVLAAY